MIYNTILLTSRLVDITVAFKLDLITVRLCVDTGMPREGLLVQTDRASTRIVDAYEAIRSEIIENVLEPGTSIPESFLTRRYSIGRSPLRDALVRLAAEGLVRVVPQVGTYVAPLDLADILEANTVRGLLECEAARNCASLGKADLVDRLERIVAMQRIAFKGDDFGLMLRLDTEFHQEIVVAGIGGTAWRIVSQMRNHYLRVRNLQVPNPATRTGSVELHARIAEAIATGDATTAVSAVKHHMDVNLSRLIELRDQRPDFFVDIPKS